MNSNIFKSGIVIPRVVKKLELKNYHSDLKGSFIMVWVNLTRAAHEEYADVMRRTSEWNARGEGIIKKLAAQIKEAEDAKKTEKQIEKLRKKNSEKFDKHLETIEAINNEMYAWYAQIWSQHKDEAHHCTTSEVRTIADTSNEMDNTHFWGWLTTRTQQMIIAHGNQHLKK